MDTIRPIQATRMMMPEPFCIQQEQVELSDPQAGQLLIETEASAISPGTELAIYTGVHQWLADPQRTWPKFPFSPGYSAVGRVLAIGSGLSGWSVGDRVVWPGRHASHALVDVSAAHPAIWRVGSDVPASIAAIAVLARFPLTALVQSGQILGQCVAVLGLGLIGQMTLRLFSAAGAYPLIGIDPLTGRRVLASATPGVQTLDLNPDDLRPALRECNNGMLPDIVVDATGAPNAVRAAMQSVCDGGKVVMVGSPRGVAGDVDFYYDLHGRSISLIGAHGTALGVEPREKFPFTRDRGMRLLLHLLESRKLIIDDLITHHVHTHELQAMYEGLLHQRDAYLGVTLHWRQSP